MFQRKGCKDGDVEERQERKLLRVSGFGHWVIVPLLCPCSLIMNVTIAPMCCGLIEGQTLRSEKETKTQKSNHLPMATQSVSGGKPNLNPGLSGHEVDVPSNTLNQPCNSSSRPGVPPECTQTGGHG